MIDRYERLPEWVRWLLLLPLSAGLTFVELCLLSLIRQDDFTLINSAAATVTFAWLLHELAPRWKNRFVVASLIFRMIFSVATVSLVFILGATPDRTTWFEIGRELLGWAAGWFVYFSVFREKRAREPRTATSKREAASRQTPPGTEIKGQKDARHRVEQVWRTLLASEGMEGLVVAEDEVDEVVSLMTESRIHPQKFAGNLEIVLTGRSQPTEAYPFAENGGGAALPSTPSMGKFLWTIDPPRGFSRWFLAGFPDVVSWFEDEQLALFNPSVDEEARTEATAKLLGIDVGASQNSDEPDLRNDDGTLRCRYCRSIVANYIRKSGKSLEAAIQEGSGDDIYLGYEFLQMLGEESNFTLVASMTTKYYLELKKRYGRSFSNETALLSMSGILDANYYIFATRQVSVAQVITLARETEGEQDRMYEFLIRFEALYMSVDEPVLSGDEVYEICRGQGEAIRGSIKRTMDSYRGEPKIVDDVRKVMSSPQFSGLRQEVGVATIRS